jgi:thymidylate synthase
MNNVDKEYFRLLNTILEKGKWKGNRTGVDCLTIAGFMFEHDMSEGFPLLTSRKLPFKSTKVELEFFIKGLNSKKWLQDRGCHYWDGWCNPQKVPYANDEETKKKMAAEDDLGLIYGTQWRNFKEPNYHQGVDQLKNVVDTLKKNPMDRRMIVSAWNPLVLPYAALPSCHYSWQVTVIDGYLNLAWNQRSCDTYLGIPANISSYALLLHLLAKESGLKEGKLIGFLMDVHLYSNHIEQTKELLNRTTYDLPTIKTDKFTSIFDWEYTDTELINYQSGAVLSAPVSV